MPDESSCDLKLSYEVWNQVRLGATGPSSIIILLSRDWPGIIKVPVYECFVSVCLCVRAS